VKNPRKFAVGLLLAGVALLATSCGGLVQPSGWASPAFDGPSAYYLQSKDHLASITLPASGDAVAGWTFPDKAKPDQKNLSLQAIYGTPVFDGDAVYVASYSGAVFALNKKDGTIRWQRTDLNGSVIASPALSGNYLAVGTVDKHLYLINKSDGSPAPGWTKDGITLKDGIWAQPIIKGDALYVATMGGEVMALRLSDATQVWSKPFHVSGAVADLTAIDDTHLFVPSLNKQVYIVNMNDGTALHAGFLASDWVWTRPAVSNGIVYFGDFSGSIYGVDITTGVQVWKYSAGTKVKAAPAVVQDTVVVADEKTLVYFFDSRTGALKMRLPLPDTNAGKVRADIVATPDGSNALIATTSGKLFRADPKNTTLTPVVVGTAQ
jgi:outer membrane protein assembly factor BamB